MQKFPSLSLETKIHPLTKFENPTSQPISTKQSTDLSLLFSPQLHQPPMVCTQEVSTPLQKQDTEEIGVVRSRSQSQSQSQSPSQSPMELFSGRSKPLHNFVLPGVNWGTQRYLRCMKVNDNNLDPNSLCKSPSPASFCDSGSQNPKFSPNSPNLANSRRVTVSEKRLETEISREVEKAESGLAAVASAAEEETRPWNLRTRRGGCKAAAATNGGERSELVFGATDCGKVREEERPKFSLSLSRKETEEDYMLMVGRKPPRRPKRRPRVVQKQLDALFPGMWLGEVTADAYKVPETNDNVKGKALPPSRA